MMTPMTGSGLEHTQVMGFKGYTRSICLLVPSTLVPAYSNLELITSSKTTTTTKRKIYPEGLVVRFQAMLLQWVPSQYLSSLRSLSPCTSASLGCLPEEEAQTTISVRLVTRHLSGHSCFSYPLVVFTEYGSSERCPTKSHEFQTYFPRHHY